MNATMLQPFLTTALPIVLSILVAVPVNNKRLDDMKSDIGRRLDKIEQRLERIEAKLDNHETRIIRLEERTSPVAGVR